MAVYVEVIVTASTLKQSCIQGMNKSKMIITIKIFKFNIVFVIIFKNRRLTSVNLDKFITIDLALINP